MFWVYKRSPSSYLTVRRHCDSVLPADAADVPLTYVDTKTGHRTHVTAKEGDNLLHTAHKHGVDLEGACECSLACSTCHVILEDSVYDSLDAPTDREEDLLDLAFGLTASSRLGCQVKVTRNMSGAEVRLPAATRNFYVDGHKPNRTNGSYNDDEPYHGFL